MKKEAFQLLLLLTTLTTWLLSTSRNPHQVLQDASIQDNLLAELRALKRPSPPDTTSWDMEAEKKKFWSYCQHEFGDYNERIQHLKLPYLEKMVVEKALANPLVPEENRLFLKELLQQLQSGSMHSNSKYETDQLLFSLMSAEGLPLGIFGNYRHKCGKNDSGYNECHVMNPEKDLKTHIPDSVFFESMNKGIPYYFHENVIDQNVQLSQQEFNIYGKPGTSTARLTSFATSLSECEDSFYYGISEADTEYLIGSNRKLSLEYGVFPEMNSILKKSITKCLDCPETQNHEAFARLKGVDNLYFVYSDDHPTPGRQLVMNMEGHKVVLWSGDLDLFGCACL